MSVWKHNIKRWECEGRKYSHGVVYSPDVGKICKIEAHEEYEGPSIWITTDEMAFLPAGKSTFARVKTRVLMWGLRKKTPNCIQEQFEYLKESLQPMNIGSSPLATDPRIVRLYILYVYEMFKRRTLEQKSETLKDGITWSLPDAREWLIRNKFRVPKEPDGFEDFDPDPEPESFAEYLFSPDKLVEPYWRP